MVNVKSKPATPSSQKPSDFPLPVLFVPRIIGLELTIPFFLPEKAKSRDL